MFKNRSSVSLLLGLIGVVLLIIVAGAISKTLEEPVAQHARVFCNGMFTEHLNDKAVSIRCKDGSTYTYSSNDILVITKHR